MHSRLFFVVLALFVLSSAEELETQYDLSPPSQAEFAAAEESLKSEIWPQRDDEYGSIGGKSQLMEIQLALADESSSERNVPLNGKGEDLPSDLLDVDVNKLIPKINTRQYRDLRNMLKRLRAKLRPLHARICKSGVSSCLARRRANVRILKSVCDKVSAKKLRSFRQKRAELCAQGLCAEGAAHLHKVSRTYTYLRRTYARLYIRYAMLIARYYQRKFRTLTRIFLSVVKKLQGEAMQMRKKNAALTKKLAQLKEQSKKMRIQTTKIHQAQIKALGDAKKEHEDQLVRSANAIRAVKAELRGEQTLVTELGMELGKLNAKLRDMEEQRARAQKDAEMVTAARNKLDNNVKELLVKIGNLAAQIKDAQRRIKELEALQHQQLHQRSLLREIVANLNAIQGANERATVRIQTSYNSLKNRYDKIVSDHSGIQKQLQEEVNGLKAGIQRQAQRCVPDACGRCNGDESTCANQHHRKACWVAGDPWVGTFDGVQYAFLHWDGQYVLARHGNPVNFEVQSFMRQFNPNWWVRTNMGVAIRGGRNVIVNYFGWGSGLILINGKQFHLPMGQWVRVGPGFSVIRQNGVQITARYETARNQMAEVMWTNSGVYTNIYINVPWQWTSGRSMWGLCGDNDGWAGNDAVFVARNTWRMFHVSNGNRDMFRNPGRRALDLELSDFSAEDIQYEQKMDKINGVLQVDDLEEYTGNDFPSLYDLEQQDSAKMARPAPTGEAKVEQVSLKASTPKMRQDTRAQCRGIHGQTRKECQFDLMRGVDPVVERRAMQTANVIGKELEIKRCTLVDSHTFMLVSSESLPKPETNREGFSYAFFFSPRDIVNKNRCVMLEQGTDFFVTQSGAKLSVGVGSAHCSVENVFRADKWTHIAFAVYRNGDLQVYVDRKPVCAAKGDGKFPLSKEQLIVGSAESNDSCNGRLAHLFYVPQSITKNEARIHGQKNPFNCHPTTKK